MNEGREQFFRTSIAMAQWAGGRIACAIIEDSTVAYHNKIHIEQINARKNVTLEVLSHDIKEPLGMIKMIVSSLEKDITPADIKLGQSLQFIREMCERNLKLIRSMVNHEFLKSTVIELQKKRADLVWEIQDVIRFYKRSNLSDSRQFDFSASQDKIYIDIDSMKFMQVINNLISNAIKFTNFGGQIAVEVLDRGDSVRISVSEALRDGLDGQPSGGLGLGIAKKIVELHNGTISFVSEVDAGTTFFIDLPKNLV
jgi:signal transduction histidine kinase